MQRNFLVVAKSGKARDSLVSSLAKKGYSVTVAASSKEAVQVVRNVAVDAVLVEGRPGDARARKLRERIGTERPGCRVALITSFSSVRNTTDLLSFGADDYIVTADEIIDLAKAPEEPGRGIQTSSLEHRGIQALIQAIDVLVGLVELDDRYFGGFSHQVMQLARAVAEEMSLEEEVIEEVVIGTLLRDIGKAGIDPEVLFSQDELTRDQLEMIQEHVATTLRLLDHVDFPWKVLPIIRHHHERYDGKGYPDGLRGREIPLGARIVSVVDSYVAMVSDRPHRPALSPEEALNELARQTGVQLDPEVIEVLIRVIDKRSAVSEEGGKPVVLIVDPHEDFRRLLKMRLLNEGLDVTAVSGVEEALETVAGRTPNVILVDVGAEGGDAFQLLGVIRDDEVLHQVPLALMTEEGDRILKFRALRHGVDDFLVKSGDLDELVARVENILTRESIRRKGHSGPRRRGVSGQIENLPLPDIVQVLSIGMKTAGVTLSSDSFEGQIYFRDGTIVHARTGELEGDSAFFEMLRWKTGEFSIEHGVRTEDSSIDSDAMFLVMEGLRRMDEASAGGPTASA